MKIEKSMISDYLTAYEEDELFYLDLYHAKGISSDYYNSYINALDPDFIKSHRLYVPDLLPEWISVMQENSFFPDIHQNIVIMKHYRYSPLFDHQHEFFEISYVYSGHCQNIIQGVPKELHAGDICIIPPGTTHSVGVFDDSVLLNIMVKSSTFQSTFFPLFNEDNILSSFFSYVLYKKTEGNYLIFNSGMDPTLHSIVEDMFIEYMGHQKYFNSILNSFLMLFWGNLLRHHENHIDSFLSHDHGDLQMTKVLLYLQSHHDCITLQSAAEHFGFSVPHFSKLIKDSTGKNFTQIIKEAKLGQACRALQTTRLSIASICELVGYQNPEHFMRIFKKEFGCTPTQYRDRN